MDDVVTWVLLGASFFLFAVAIGLLFRYRQISKQVSTSTDLGHDLWSALEGRLKKQDERLVDLMARLDVVQSKVMTPVMPTSLVPASPPSAVAQHVVQPEPTQAVMAEPRHVSDVAASQESQEREQTGEEELVLDETLLAIGKLLGKRAMSTIEIKESIDKSREHTARLMKSLFVSGLVSRSERKKPFVYELTDKGRHLLSNV